MTPPYRRRLRARSRGHRHFAGRRLRVGARLDRDGPPGVQTFTAGAQCTANFIYSDGTDTYIGQAAHCSGTGAATDTDGCVAESLPDGTPVEVTGASRPGTLVYNSWNTMQANGETDPDTCAYNDLALVKLDPADVAVDEPLGSRLRRPDRHGEPRRHRLDGLHVRQLARCAAASRS